ncbi:ABC transporter substrate-binding protein [Paenibacillus sp. 481]|uniref:ABC transporter substrate-binding protein n=1 Tax=Paenibacillus sp. 481 TaxID=2835869 RepID=UPI001E5A5856|nr:ABC transporter substrate-binding protein [Paenibacillus sp. 481]UHA71637.1 ABC transporter substrate-binding protein [Paenibacillus sp. 481]
MRKPCSRKIILRTLVCCLLCSSLFTALPVQAKPASQPLKIGITKDENSLTPYTYVTGVPGRDLVDLMYDTLFQLDAQNVPKPWLVQQFEVSTDSKMIKLTLHQDVKWSDGKPLTAHDVKFTIDYFLQHPKSRFTNPLKAIAKVDVQSNHQLSLLLTEPQPNFMIQPLADMPILPQHVWGAISEPEKHTQPMGSGPYILNEYVAGQYYKFSANANYFKGKPVAKELILPIIEDQTALFTALTAGQLDAVAATVSPEVVSQFESNAKLKLEQGAGLATSLLLMNHERYPMSEPAFRQAVTRSIDTQELVDTITLGRAIVGNPGFIHPSSPQYKRDLAVKTDRAEAKRILDSAGFTDRNGDGWREGAQGEKIELELLVYSGKAARIRSAEMIAGWLKETGINIKVKSMDMTTVDALVWPDFDVKKGRNFDLSMWSWSSTMQLFPDRLVDLFHSNPDIGASNLGGYRSAEFDRLAAQLAKTHDNAARTSTLQAMQTLIATDAPIVTLYYEHIVNAYNPTAFNQYVFQQGKGILNKWSLVATSDHANRAASKTSNEKLSENLDASKTTASAQVETSNTSSTSSSSSSTRSLLILLVLAGCVLAAVFLLRKRSKHKQAGNSHTRK